MKAQTKISKERAAQCTTHHLGCDCREYQAQQMEWVLRVIYRWASSSGNLKTLESSNVMELIEEALSGE